MFQDKVDEALDEHSMNSMKVTRFKQLALEEKKISIDNAIDFLNLIFGNGLETLKFWEMLKKLVLSNYEI
jgi:hypothetical protein